MAINPLQMNDLENMEQDQKFTITDLSSLTWALRKLAAIEAKKAEVNAVSDAEIERIEAYRKKEIDVLQGSEHFFKSLITEYAIKKREEDPKFRNEKTPYGSIGFRKQQPKWNYDDEALLTFLEENNPALIRVKKEPVKTEIKKLFQVSDDGRVFDGNGQEVTGIKVEFLPETIDVKVEV